MYFPRQVLLPNVNLICWTIVHWAVGSGHCSHRKESGNGTKMPTCKAHSFKRYCKRKLVIYSYSNNEECGNVLLCLLSLDTQ